MNGNFSDLQDLRIRYGVHFDSQQQETVSEELALFRNKQIKQRRIMMAGMIVAGVII